MPAVKKYGKALKYASDDLFSDREIVMATVNTIGWALE